MRLVLGRGRECFGFGSGASYLPGSNGSDIPESSEDHRLSSSRLDSGYSLCLKNNQRWRIIGLDGLEEWAHRFAVILELKSAQEGDEPTLTLKPWDTTEKVDPELAPDLMETVELLPDGRRACYPTILRLPPDASIPGPRKLFRPPILRVLLHNGSRHVSFEVDEIPSYLSYMTEQLRKKLEAKAELIILRHVVYTLYRQAQALGAIPLHSALVARDGLGVVLMGNGGAGKSTCCQRLPSNWEALSDDEALVVRDERGRYLAHPFPTWSNFRVQRDPRTWCTERSVPVAAIFFLEQATTDAVVPMGRGHAALLTNQAAWQVWRACSEALRGPEGGGNRALGLQIIENACALARSVPAFTLRVSLTGRFWEHIERVLSELASRPN